MTRQVCAHMCAFSNLMDTKCLPDPRDPGERTVNRPRSLLPHGADILVEALWRNTAGLCDLEFVIGTAILSSGQGSLPESDISS